MRQVYLDNNATTGLDPLVLEAMLPVLTEFPFNPSSVHFFGQKAKEILCDAREIIASSFKARPHEILFTSGGTEGINMLIKGFDDPGHCITSKVEHASVYKGVKSLEGKKWKCTFLDVDSTGKIDLEQLEHSIQENTRFIMLSAANPETGVKLPLREVAEIAEKRGVPLFIDAVALMGKELFSVPSGVTALVASAHKFHGPKGIGFVLIRPQCKLSPLHHGGHQEFAKRGGTENIPGIVGCAKAVSLLNTLLPDATHRMHYLRDRLEADLIESVGAQVNGSGDRIANTSNLYFPHMDGETLLLSLDMHGIAASHGSACSAGALEPSRVLLNMGLSYSEARSSLRFSLSRWTTEEEIDHALHILRQLHVSAIES